MVDDALVEAVKRNDVRGVRLLIATGADVNERHVRDMTALMLASKKGYVSCVRMLLEAGTHVNVSGGMRQTYGFLGFSGYFGQMEKTPLIFAAENGHCECVKSLIEAGADVNESDYFEDSALMYASKVKDSNCAHILIKSGADVNSVNCMDKTALFFAIENENADTLKSLIDGGADVNKTDSDNSMLMLAVESDYSTCAEYLIAAGADVNCVNEQGETALFVTLQNQNAQIMKSLIAAGADVNMTNSEGMTAIKQASVNNDDKCLGILIKARNQDGQPKTPLPGLFDLLLHPNHLVNIRCVKLLMAAGAKINENGVDDNFLLRYSLRSDSCPTCMVDPGIYRLMAAAGEVDTTSDYVGEPALNFPWFLFDVIPDLSLKYLCREDIRKHLLELDPHSHLFGRIPQIGFPSLLNRYLLYDVKFENDDDNDSDCEKEEEEFTTGGVTPV